MKNEYLKDKNWWIEMALLSDLYPEKNKIEMKKELRRRKLKKIYIQ
jgi:hypothetical protein